ncbi:hypothetical protein [Ferruginibacter sp. HRS2-29]|uniref:hypothetical protein n=1 Tax=Ferruginibacter sp. HRS2-29 TaxID=2487334 RepID=UPI0020CCA2EF|nr:hypothetical protein [Ferruginibacter sp. HRS2-29]MCP9751961.1 hypothetical protein [Ferruginibacter sp. HRS2-29]
MKTFTQPITTLSEAYATIHDFFSCYHLHEAVDDLNRMFGWACKEGYYKKSAPANLLFHAQQLHRLFCAAEIIRYSTGRKMSPVLFHHTVDKASPVHFKGTHTPCTEWECYPRHLTAEEYLNPYWAFEKLTGMRNWEAMLQELMESALSKGSIEGNYTIREVMDCKENMLKVVEGSWLIEIRNNKFN